MINWQTVLGNIRMAQRCMASQPPVQTIYSLQQRGAVSRVRAQHGIADWSGRDVLEVDTLLACTGLGLTVAQARHVWLEGVTGAKDHPDYGGDYGLVIMLTSRDGKAILRPFNESTISGAALGFGFAQLTATRLLRVSHLVRGCAERIAAVAPHVIVREKVS